MSQAVADRALDLQEGLWSADEPKGCKRWPPDLRLQSDCGALVMGRCKATNLCDYCAKLSAVENAEVLAQDALTNSAPGVWTVLTTKSHVAEMSAYRVARRAALLEVRRWRPDARRATMIEFTTGLGTRSDGHRRPHWNDVWKGIEPSETDELHERIAWAWCKRVEAVPEAQYVGTISETGGLMRYLALHFQKESQQPPEGWSGQRFNVGRGYLATPMAEAREQARAALRLRRELWRAENQLGLTGTAALEYAQAAVEEASALVWQLVRLVEFPTAWDDDGRPSRFTVEPVEVG